MIDAILESHDGNFERARDEILELLRAQVEKEVEMTEFQREKDNIAHPQS